MSKVLLPIASLSAALAVALGSLPALAAPASAKTVGVQLSATLSGANEVDERGVGNKGDPDGTGTFTGRLAPKTGQLCYTLTWSGIDAPTMAHIHMGPIDKSGPVVVPFPDITPGEHCTDVDRTKTRALLSRPKNFYVNVHNPAFPAGAVRGQLAKQK